MVAEELFLCKKVSLASLGQYSSLLKYLVGSSSVVGHLIEVGSSFETYYHRLF